MKFSFARPIAVGAAMCFFMPVQTTLTLARSASVSVMVGGEANYDACCGVGKVVGLDPKGDNFLSVRSGPGSKYDEIDRLYIGGLVYLCDERGAWQGVVYPTKGCGVTTSIDRRQPYTGNCKSGWIFGKYVMLVAG